MARTVGIGHQDFEEVIRNGDFYVDKTSFIREWWENRDVVTLITRPRRFGKTLTMSMTEHFFSNRYAGQGEIFEGLSIWESEEYRNLQGTWPVISLSFALVKETDFKIVVHRICEILQRQYIENYFILDSNVLTEGEKQYFKKLADGMTAEDAPMALHHLSDYMHRYFGKKVIILLDEYDTPLQEAYVSGYWKEMSAFIRVMFHAAFKTNPSLERAILTGITRISKESMFSYLNNLETVTTTSDKYADIFGFTEQEVFAAMDEMGYTNREAVKAWYDGFTFGEIRDIYNPWSIINFLDKGKIGAYWVNSSENSLVNKLLQEGEPDLKIKFEELLMGKSIKAAIDEEIVYQWLEQDSEAVYSLLLASGYLKVIQFESCEQAMGEEKPVYELILTNGEVRYMFKNLVSKWFKVQGAYYNDFIKALLLDDLDAMNEYMERVVGATFSCFDTAGSASGKAEPERFYHGFVLGLMMELEDRYVITSNRESGFGRYDIMLEPKKEGLNAYVIEFKVRHKKKDTDLTDTVKAALDQIEEKQYEKQLVSRGIAPERIRKYGFAFEGKQVLIG